MAWFKRKEKGIQTPTEEKKDVPKGLWYKSPTGKVVDTEELAKNLWVSPEDDFHVRIGSAEYFEILFDNNEFEELNPNIVSKDSLKFVDTKKYSDRLKEVMAKDVELECRKLGLLLNAVNENTLRLAPALIVNIDQVKRCAEIIDDALRNVKKGLKK